jgi:hypothetical protein
MGRRTTRRGDDRLAGGVRVPGFHRRPLIRVREVRENGVRAVDVGEITLDQLAIAPLGAAA